MGETRTGRCHTKNLLQGRFCNFGFTNVNSNFTDSGNKVWYLRLVLEREDRLNRNHEEKERNWNISYSAISEDWFAMENLTESVLEQLAKQETVAEILQDLSERQKCIIQKYYLQEETQEQISNELGISQQAVSATISHAIRMIRSNY